MSSMGSLGSLSASPGPDLSPPAASTLPATPSNPSGLTSGGVPLGTDPLQTPDTSFNATIDNPQGAGSPNPDEAFELANSALNIAQAAGSSADNAGSFASNIYAYSQQIGKPGGISEDDLKGALGQLAQATLPDISADKQQQVDNLVGVGLDQISQTNNQTNQFAVVDPSKGVAPLGNTVADTAVVQKAISTIYGVTIPAGDNLNTYNSVSEGFVGENGNPEQAGLSVRADGTANINTSDLAGLDPNVATANADGRAANELGNRDSDFLARPDGNPLSNYLTNTQDELVSDATSSAADPGGANFSTTRLQDAAINFTQGENHHFDYGATNLAVATSTGNALVAAGSTTALQLQSQGQNAEQIGQDFLTGLNGGTVDAKGGESYGDPGQFRSDIGSKAADWGTANPEIVAAAIPQLASGELEKDGRNLVAAAYNAPYQTIDATNATYGTAQGPNAVSQGPSDGALATASRYLASNPDLLASVSDGQTGSAADNATTLDNAIDNFDTIGGAQGRQITFDPQAYLAGNPDAAARVAALGVQGDAQNIAASFDSLDNASG